jgi:beta-phosphoglucomutase
MSIESFGPTAVVFDMDGVLIDSSACHRMAFEQVFEPFGILDFKYSRYAGWRTTEVVETVLREAAIEFTPGIVIDLARAKTRAARERLAATNPVAPDCVPVLKRLSREYALALASSGSRSSVDLFLTANNCGHLFKSVLCGDDVAYSKPHPEIYRRSFAALDVPPASAAVIEDAVAGIISAKTANAGVVIGVAGTCPGSELSAAGADCIAVNLVEIPGILKSIYDKAISN